MTWSQMWSELAPGVRALTLGNAQIEVTILPDKGADVYSLVHRATGTDVLLKSPWGVRAPGLWPRATTTMERWIEGYPGGWQLLLPNGGDECIEQDATWGFHGEAALVPWTVLDQTGSTATLETTLFLAPLHVRRELSLDGPVLRLREVVTNLSGESLEVMWSHHPAFGPPFLDGGCTLAAGCRSVVADDREPGALLRPGSRHKWPKITTPEGETVDLSRIPAPNNVEPSLPISSISTPPISPLPTRGSGSGSGCVGLSTHLIKPGCGRRSTTGRAGRGSGAPMPSRSSLPRPSRARGSQTRGRRDRACCG